MDGLKIIQEGSFGLALQECGGDKEEFKRRSIAIINVTTDLAEKYGAGVLAYTLAVDLQGLEERLQKLIQ